MELITCVINVMTQYCNISSKLGTRCDRIKAIETHPLRKMIIVEQVLLSFGLDLNKLNSANQQSHVGVLFFGHRTPLAEKIA